MPEEEKLAPEPPAKDDATLLGELLLNSPIWIALSAGEKQGYVNTNDAKYSWMLIAQFLIDNRDIRIMVLNHIATVKPAEKIIKQHPEKDNTTALGKLILSMPIWIAFRTMDNGMFVHSNNPKASWIIVAQYLLENVEIKVAILDYVKEKTKLELYSGFEIFKKP